jgi:magnesium-transporting ATPase (P-type)
MDCDNLINPKKPELGYNEGSNGGPYYEPKGSDIEKALIQFLVSSDLDVDALLKARNKNCPVHFFLPFSQKERMVIKVRELPRTDDQEEPMLKVYLQGAPESVMKYCQFYINADGGSDPLDADTNVNILSN